MSKSIRLILAALVALPLLALAALYLLVNPTKLAPLFTAQLTQTLNRPASIEGLSFHLFPLSFTATNLVIAEDPAFSREPFLKASSVEIRPELFPLLTGAVKIQSLRVLAPEPTSFW
jgi:AsmA protein